ncbi:hypothetical protein pb186bvf_011819 [Paramecium bursaria]
MEYNSDAARIYIENQIVPQGFQAIQFINFLKTKKTNGDDLGLWNMDELIEVGNEFLSTQKPEQQQEVAKGYQYPPLEQIQQPQLMQYPQQPLVPQIPQIPQNTQIQQIPYPIQPQNLPQNVPYPPAPQVIAPQVMQPETRARNQSKQIDKGSQRYVVNPGPRIQPNPSKFLQKHPNIEVKIIGADKQDGSVFSKSFILYQIQLNPYGYIIYRRYSDFDKLREYLIKSYPEYIIPPIAKKVNSSKDPSVIGYRQLALEKFLNLIVKGFWFDNVVDGFFESQNESDLQKIMKNPPTRICDCTNTQTLSGQIECQISTQIDSFFTQSQIQLDKYGDIYRKIRNISKKIVDDNKTLQNDYKELSSCYQNLANCTKLWNDSMPEKIDDSLFIQARDLFTQWSVQQEKISDQFKKYLGDFYKYQNQIYDTIKERVKYRDQQKDDIMKATKKLDEKKEKLFKEQNTSKWEIPKDQLAQFTKDQLTYDEKLVKEIMLPLEQKQLLNLTDTYGYINNSLYQQIQYALTYSMSQTVHSIKSCIIGINNAYNELLTSFAVQCPG